MNKRAETFSRISDGLDRWAKRSKVSAARDVSKHLAEIHRAGSAILEAIENLGRADSQERMSKELVAIDEWIYQELVDHLDALREPLQRTIESAHQ